MTRRVPFAFKPNNPTPGMVQFGTPVVSITIQIDERGLMRTSINKPLPAVQIIGILLDSMQGQYQAMAQQASLLINPNGKPANTEGIAADGGKEEENNNDRGRDSAGGVPA